MQADSEFPDDTVGNAKRELAVSEKRLEQTRLVVEEARHVARSLATERTTNHWAKTIYEQWAPGAGRHTA
jgi:hypothetical protein